MRSSTVFPPPRTARGQDADAPRGRSDDECAAAAPGGSRPFVASGRVKQSPSVVERRSPLETTKHGYLGAFPELLRSSSPTPATGFDLKILSAARSPLSPTPPSYLPTFLPSLLPTCTGARALPGRPTACEARARAVPGRVCDSVLASVLGIRGHRDGLVRRAPHWPLFAGHVQYRFGCGCLI